MSKEKKIEILCQISVAIFARDDQGLKVHSTKYPVTAARKCYVPVRLQLDDSRFPRSHGFWTLHRGVAKDALMKVQESELRAYRNDPSVELEIWCLEGDLDKATVLIREAVDKEVRKFAADAEKIKSRWENRKNK